MESESVNETLIHVLTDSILSDESSHECVSQPIPTLNTDFISTDETRTENADLHSSTIINDLECLIPKCVNSTFYDNDSTHQMNNSHPLCLDITPESYTQSFLLFDPDKTVSNIKKSVADGSFWNYHDVVKSPMDGHCILHSIITCITFTHPEYDCLLLHEYLKTAIITECKANMSLYLPYYDGRGDDDFFRALYQYLNFRIFNQSFVDMIPNILSNALQKTIIILDSQNNVFLITPHPDCIDKKIDNDHCILFKSGLHYDACVSNSLKADAHYREARSRDIWLDMVKPVHARPKGEHGVVEPFLAESRMTSLPCSMECISPSEEVYEFSSVAPSIGRSTTFDAGECTPAVCTIEGVLETIPAENDIADNANTINDGVNLVNSE